MRDAEHRPARLIAQTYDVPPVGVDDLLHILVDDVPSPETGRPKRLWKGDSPDVPAVELPAKAEDRKSVV